MAPTPTEEVPNATGGQLKDFSLNQPLPNSRHHRQRVCRFCLNNGEEEDFYRTHYTKDVYGKASCPVLRKYVCPLCSATGDLAHTVKYCPSNSNTSWKPGNLRSVGLADEMNRAMGQNLAEGMSCGLVDGMTSSVGQWINQGMSNFSGGFKMDEAMGGQSGALFKDKIMRMQLQQKTAELDMLKRQLTTHLSTRGCGDPGEIMRMAAQAGARHFAQARRELPTPMEGHLRNSRADHRVAGDEGRGRTERSQGDDRVGRSKAVTLGDHLEQLREGSVPHHE